MVINTVDNNIINTFYKFNMVVTMNSKQARKKLLGKVREHCLISNTDIALLSDHSPTLVSYVWSGINSNKKVLNIIMENLKEGWDDKLTATEVAQIKELCRN